MAELLEEAEDETFRLGLLQGLLRLGDLAALPHLTGICRHLD